jgi:voltage-gated potassium channel Kch
VRWRREAHGRYGLLLILLIGTYLMSAFTSGDWVGGVQLLLFVATGLLALRASRLSAGKARVIAAVGVVGSAVAFVLAITGPSQAAIGAASIWTGLVLLATVAIIIRRILAFPTVTEQSIYGAVSAYLILGLMFASFYAALYHLHGQHFFAHGNRLHPGNSQTFQYFSFTTLTTLGYGDFTAAGSGGRAVAVLEALTGQVFLATLVARLVATFRGPTAAAQRPADLAGHPPDEPERLDAEDGHPDH